MATTPAKSQPLHNFSFSFLNWSTTAHAGTVHHRSSPDSVADPDPPRPVRVGSRSARVHRFSSSSRQRSYHRQETAVKKVGETAHRPCNLSPRKPEMAVAIVLALEKQIHSSASAAPSKSTRLRGSAAENGVAYENKEKSKFWIALSKEEIEEDIFIMTGSRPARRPKKRPKNVQKQLDTVFPGLWMVGSTAEAFRVPDSPVKR